MEKCWDALSTCPKMIFWGLSLVVSELLIHLSSDPVDLLSELVTVLLVRLVCQMVELGSGPAERRVDAIRNSERGKREGGRGAAGSRTQEDIQQRGRKWSDI